MPAEEYVALAVGLAASVAVVLGPILLYLVKLRHETKVMRMENHRDHGKVVNSVDHLTGQVTTLGDQMKVLTALVIDSVSELRAHVKWEETKKYTTMDDLREVMAEGFAPHVNPSEATAAD